MGRTASAGGPVRVRMMGGIQRPIAGRKRGSARAIRETEIRCLDGSACWASPQRNSPRSPRKDIRGFGGDKFHQTRQI